MDPRSVARRLAAGSCLLLGWSAVACGPGAEPGEPGEPSVEITSPAQPPSTSASGPDPTAPADGVIPVAVEVVATHPHDPGAYTQGLELTADGLLLESTGLLGRSSLRLVRPATGEVLRATSLDDELFGEGATVVDGEAWQLTWRNEVALVHGLDDLAERRRVPYEGEGWGLCATPDRLVMSDGSSRLTFRDRSTFDPLGTVEVTAENRPVTELNELECVGDLVWANVYQTTRLLAIDPTDGRVVGEADLAPLVPPELQSSTGSVANGIAHDPGTGRFWLTGKNWPVLYEVELVPAEPLRPVSRR